MCPSENNGMKATIFTINAERDTGSLLFSGHKKSRVESDDFEVIQVSEGLQIRAKAQVTYGTGEEGGTPSTYNSTLIVNLSKCDVERIVLAAFANKVTMPPGAGLLIEAKHLLEKAIAEMNTHE
jgi:hypothetical protein